MLVKEMGLVEYPFELMVVFKSSNVVGLEMFRDRAWIGFNIVGQQDHKIKVVFVPLAGLNMMPMEAMGD